MLLFSGTFAQVLELCSCDIKRYAATAMKKAPANSIAATNKLSICKLKRRCVLRCAMSAAASGQWGGFPREEAIRIQPIMTGYAHEHWLQLLTASKWRDCMGSLGEKMLLAVAAVITLD